MCVKGNSNWDKIYFDNKDKNGLCWISAGGKYPEPDLKEDIAINHDGWRFIYRIVPQYYPSGYYSQSACFWYCSKDSLKNALKRKDKISTPF